MKKAVLLILAAGLLFAALTAAAVAAGGNEQGPPPQPEAPRSMDPDTSIEEIDWPILVDGVRIKAPAPLLTGAGCRMVPLRAIAEALGYEVIWCSEARSVTLRDTIKLWIGLNKYETDEEVLEITCYAISVPIIRNNYTYVPFCFFRDLLEMSESNTQESMIQIISD